MKKNKKNNDVSPNAADFSFRISEEVANIPMMNSNMDASDFACMLSEGLVLHRAELPATLIGGAT